MNFNERIRIEFAELLAKQVGRSWDDLVTNGLINADFPNNQDVEIKLPDGSSAYFKHAFYVINPNQSQVAVFTEHSGHHVYSTVGIEIFTRRKENLLGR